MGQSTYIYAGWIIDGSGGPIRERVLLEMVDGIITDMCNCNTNELPVNCVDLAHCTLLPPLVDSHLHLWMSGSIDKQIREQQLTAGYEELHPVITQHLTDLLSHGVLAVRDGGDKSDSVFKYLSERPSGPARVVVTKVAGRAWHSKGRYGSFIGRHPKEGESLAKAYLHEQGPEDHVKLVNSGLNSLYKFGRETAPQFFQEEIKELVLLARKNKKKVMVHANGREPVRVALEAGCDSIEHGFFMGRENLKLMADRGVVWVPTVYTMKAYAQNLKEKGQGSRDIAEKTYKHQIQQISMARDLGVTIALGTDSGSLGVLHGESVIEELKLYAEAGCSLAEAIKCATYNGSRLLGIDDMGRVAKGRPANFIVARGAASQLPGRLSSLEAIYREGMVLKGNQKNPLKVVIPGRRDNNL